MPTQLTPPPYLQEQIMQEIRFQQRIRALKRKLILYSSGLCCSITALAIVAQDFYLQAHQSGFWNFGSLLVSDFHAVTAHLSDYALSLAESLPAISFAFVCVALLAIVASGASALRSAAELKTIRLVK